MWAVIRARQGLPHEHVLQSSFEANCTQLVAFSCKPNPEELPADAVTLAFERATHPKLTKLVTADELVHRQKALAMIDKLCSSPIEVAKFLEVGIVFALNKGTEDADGQARILASHVLVLVAREKSGRDQMLSAGSIPVLQRLLADAEEQVRAHACQAFAALCIESQHRTSEEVISAGTVSHLVARTAEESERVLPHLLFALKMCMMHKQGLEDAITYGGIASMASLLASPSEAVREGACHNLFCLAVPTSGKIASLDEGAVPGLLPRLVELLRDPLPAVQTEAAAALMAMTVSIPAKHRCIECGACDALIAIATDGDTEPRLRTNAIKAMAMLAEAPRGRAALMDVVPALEEIEADARADLADAAAGSAQHRQLLKAHAKRAREIITWRP
jgi:hypothetical protein